MTVPDNTVSQPFISARNASASSSIAPATVARQIAGYWSGDHRSRRVTKTNNIAILIHAVALSLRGSGRLDTRLDTPPISLRYHLRLSSCQRGDALEKKRRKLMEAWAVGSVRRRNRVRS
jgi:hypothetical protein